MGPQISWKNQSQIGIGKVGSWWKNEQIIDSSRIKCLVMDAWIYPVWMWSSPPPMILPSGSYEIQICGKAIWVLRSIPSLKFCEGIEKWHWPNFCYTLGYHVPLCHPHIFIEKNTKFRQTYIVLFSPLSLITCKLLNMEELGPPQAGLYFPNLNNQAMCSE